MDDQLRVQGINQLGFGIIPKMVMQDRELNIASKAIYAYFCSYAGTGDSCFPTRKKICYDLCISNDTLGKYLKELTSRGYIEIEQVKENGRFSHNIYSLCSTVLPYPKKPYTESSDTEELDTKNNSIYKNNSSKNNRNKKEIHKESSDELFECDSSSDSSVDFNADNSIKADAFYQRVKDNRQVLMHGVDIAYAFDMLYKQYPKHAGKKEAATAFLKLVRKDTRENIIDLAINIDTYRKYVGDNGTEDRYIKMFSGFIRDTQYNEYPQYNCKVMRNKKHYETRDEYMEAVRNGEISLYCLPQSSIMF